ncbi:MAG TPA: response regulator [Burkholderiales bacterium]|nr:response regulator [Burkholderiales bacterium]
MRAAGDLTRILLIEDDDDIRTVTVSALELVGGFSVRACGSAAQGLEAIAEFGPQLVLLDVMMPGMDGVQLLAELRRRADTAALPVVFLTAKARTEEISRLRGLGALGVIAKPFDPMTLAEQVRSLWKGSS